MHNKIKDLVIISTVVVLLVAGGYAVFSLRFSSPTKSVACTKEAKLCPDGSAVGRTGSNCEFATCPVAQILPEIIPGVESLLYSNEKLGFQFLDPQNSTDYPQAINYLHVTKKLGAAIALPEVMLAGTNLGEAVFAVGVDADPTVVSNCTKLSELENKDLGPAIINGVKFEAFSGADPAAGNLYESKVYRTVYNGICYEVVELLHSGNIYNYPSGTVQEFDRVKFFGILEKIAQTLKLTANLISGVDGLVTLSPICPVERIPPDPNCAPKPYQIRIQITKADDVTFSQEITSGADGKIGVGLAPGTYQFNPVSVGILPRCNSATVVVKSGAWTTIDISCDTGIR